LDNDKTEITQRIASLNDEFRQSVLKPASEQSLGEVFCTAGIMALSKEDIQAIAEKVRDFDEFNKGNDPYGEHDFGSFIHKDEKVYWKIDYRNPHAEYQSEDVNDKNDNNRILTIMLSHEY